MFAQPNVPDLRSYIGAPGATLLREEALGGWAGASWAGSKKGLGFAVSDAFKDVVASAKSAFAAHSGSMAGAVASSRQRFDAFATLVRKEMMAPSIIFKYDPQVATVMKYDVTCTDRNIEKYMYRDDIYEICRRELYFLLRSFDRQIYFQGGGANVSFDWMEMVYRWASIAFFAVGVHPIYLFADPNERTAEGEYVPQYRKFPQLVAQAMAGIQTQLEAEGALHYKDHAGEYWFGPTIGGWLSEDNVSTWFQGNFEPDYAQRRMWGSNFGNEQHEAGNRQSFGTAGRLDSLTRNGVMGYFVATFDEASDIADAKRYTKDRNTSTKVTKAISARGMLRIAKAWAASIVDTLNMEFAVDSLEWYLHNHMTYFVSRGSIDMSPEELRAQQNALAEQRAAVRDAKLDAGLAVADVAVDAIEEAYPIYEQIIRAAYNVVKGALKLLFGWIFRRRKPQKVPQPFTLRTLAYGECATAHPNQSIEDQLRSTIAITVEDAHEQGVMTNIQNPGPGGWQERYAGPDAGTDRTMLPILAGAGIVLAIGWGLTR